MKTHRLMDTILKFSAAIVLSGLMVFNACTIQPPLHLPTQDILTELPIVETRLETIWNFDTLDWEKTWYYGWDEEDIRRWGPLEYPKPEYYEIRRYFTGDVPHAPHTNVSSTFVNNTKFRERVPFGWHDMLVWSDFGFLPFGQAVIIDEKSDLDNVMATTSTSTMRFSNGNRSTANEYDHFNNPEIFYRGYLDGFYVSRDTADYDYFDPIERLWVLKQKVDLVPAVYIYLVQVILYNNRGRVIGLNDFCAVNGLSRITNLTTGHTGLEDVSVIFDMRMKNQIRKDTVMVDIIGGELTTFGLCDQGPYQPTRGRTYDGHMGNIHNHFTLNASFSNYTDSIYVYDVTDQFQSQCHGGIITVEIDVDTLNIPVSPIPDHPGSSFDPLVQDYSDEEYEIQL